MKGKTGSLSTGVIIAVLVILFGGFLGWSIFQKQSANDELPDYDITTIIEADENNGNIGDHIEGDKNAKIKIVEYSDFQCSGCRSVVDNVKKLVEKYEGKVAVIHRSYILSYHQNGIAAASAAEAAGLQGYWKPYGDYLFKKQEDWFYSDAEQRTEQFKEYFTKVTNGKGDVDKFLEDMASEKVKAKVDFDLNIAKKLSNKIQYTPAFFIGDELIDWAYDNEEKLSFVDYFSKIIDERL